MYEAGRNGKENKFSFNEKMNEHAFHLERFSERPKKKKIE